MGVVVQIVEAGRQVNKGEENWQRKPLELRATGNGPSHWEKAPDAPDEQKQSNWFWER